MYRKANRSEVRNNKPESVEMNAVQTPKPKIETGVDVKEIVVQIEKQNDDKARSC